MVFDRVVGSSIQDLCNFSPFVAYLSMLQKQGPLLFRLPIFLLDFGIQVIMPSFPALLSYSSRKVVSD